MPNYVPCRHGEDERAHLYPAAHPEHTLCGIPTTDHAESSGDSPVCVDCAKALVSYVLHHTGPGRVTSIDITVNS